MKQKRWAERDGVHFHAFSGDFTIYCFWRQVKHQLISRDIPVKNGSIIQIGDEFVLQIRRELRNFIDPHVVQMVSGRFARVIRLGRDAYFRSVQKRPIYASIDHLKSGVLAGVVESARGPNWLIMKSQHDYASVRAFLYEMWFGFIGLYDRLVTEMELILPKLSEMPVEIILDLGDFEGLDDLDPSKPPPNEAPEILTEDIGRVRIKFKPDFIYNFNGFENIGEKLVLKALAQGLVTLHLGSERMDDVALKTVLDRVIGDKAIRVIHLFASYHPLDYLLHAQEQRITFLAHEDFVFSKLKLSDGCLPVKARPVLTTKDECNSYLHKVVQKVWGILRALLKKFDRTSLLRQLLAMHEAVIQDRDHWRRTAQAVIALYSAQEAYAAAEARDKDRDLVALPIRTIIEMAICECPLTGGRKASKWDIDELLAKVALLIEAATDSDAIQGELLEPEIHIHANGEYTIDRTFYETVIHPFRTNFFKEAFEEDASEYPKLYERPTLGERLPAESHFSGEFINAFSTEFGLTPDQSLDAVAELEKLAVENQEVVVETTLGIFFERLMTKGAFSPGICQSFMKAFALFHRSSWDKPPSGFRNKDLYPWRFRRRLSNVIRPILSFGELAESKILYGAGSLMQSFYYRFERVERGQLPTDFFISDKMKQYIGSVNDKRGHAFAESTANELRGCAWEARTEVQMTELGASSELGDIDVLAWKKDGEILLIECKRLQLARTVAEIAEICNRFRGQAKDELAKHIKRVQWVFQNPESLKHIIGFVPRLENMKLRLVTNTHVPIMYLTSLPIRPHEVVPLNLLISNLSSN